jgi:ESX secretion system protein EccE
MSGSSRLLDTQGVSGISQEFLVPPGMLDAISPAGDRGGMMLGSGMQGEPLTISLLRPTPTRIVLVGGLYMARQVALRAMAVGAWVVVATGRPASWQVLQKAAGTGPDGRPAPLVQIRRLSPVELPRPSEDAPLLVVHDGGPTPQELFPPRSAWQTTVYVLPYMHPQAGATANAADLVLLQRLPVGQAQLAARIWRLPPPMMHELTQLPDEHVVALGNSLWKRLRLITTQKEQAILGPVRRGD